CDATSRQAVFTLRSIVAPRATGLKSRLSAARFKLAKSYPVAENTSLALSSRIQPDTAGKCGLGSFVWMSKFSRAQELTTTEYGYPAIPVSWTISAPAAPTAAAISYL